MHRQPAITVRACKASGQPYRWWTAELIDSHALGVVLDKAVGTPVTQPNGTWISPYQIRSYYWFTRWYNLLEVWNTEHVLQEVYIHIASPAVLDRSVLTYIDYELDVVRPDGQAARIVDEDEFEEARSTYDLQLQAQCRAACEEALRLAAEWVTGLDPVVALRQAPV